MEQRKPLGLLQPTSAGVLAKEYRHLHVRFGSANMKRLFFLVALYCSTEFYCMVIVIVLFAFRKNILMIDFFLWLLVFAMKHLNMLKDERHRMMLYDPPANKRRGAEKRPGTMPYPAWLPDVHFGRRFSLMISKSFSIFDHSLLDCTVWHCTIIHNLSCRFVLHCFVYC